MGFIWRVRWTVTGSDLHFRKILLMAGVEDGRAGSGGLLRGWGSGPERRWAWKVTVVMDGGANLKI